VKIPVVEQNNTPVLETPKNITTNNITTVVMCNTVCRLHNQTSIINSKPVNGKCTCQDGAKNKFEYGV
jgi:hypothetical protein